jgi:hypothetical protein
MSRRKRRKPQAKQRSPGWWASKSSADRRRIVWRSAAAIGGAAAVLALGVGGYVLEQRVVADEWFQQPPILRLADAPEALQAEILSSLTDESQASWNDPDLCRRVAAALEENPWVQRVRSVRKYADRTVEIRCDYREPAALVQIDSTFYLVASDQVRLPGTYAYDPFLVFVQGVASPAPPAGQRWSAPELRAAMAVAERLEQEPFASQVAGILVHNYGGRENNEEAHIRLVTDRPGSTIIWGSAPGEELEETTADQKVAILRDNYSRFGRIDANRHLIDISIYPDRFTTPG